MFRFTRAQAYVMATSMFVGAFVFFSSQPAPASTPDKVWYAPDTGVCQQHWDNQLHAYTKLTIRPGATAAEIDFCQKYGDATIPVKMYDPNAKDGIARLADGSYALFWTTYDGVVPANGPNAVHFSGPNGSPTGIDVTGPPTTPTAPRPPGVRDDFSCHDAKLSAAETAICQQPGGVAPPNAGPAGFEPAGAAATRQSK